MFNYVLPNAEESSLATSFLLLEELKRYNEFEWNADRVTIISWRTTEGYPADAAYCKEEGYQEATTYEVYNTESQQNFAFQYCGRQQSFHWSMA